MNIAELDLSSLSFKNQLSVFLFHNGVTSKIDILTFGSDSGKNCTTTDSTLQYLKKLGLAENPKHGLWILTKNGIEHVKRLYDVLRVRNERMKMSDKNSAAEFKEKVSELEMKNRELEEKVKQLEADNARYIRIIDRVIKC